MEYHQKLEDHFSGFSFTLFSWKPKLLRDVGGLTIFVFLPELTKNHDSQFLGFSPKLKKHKYHSHKHEIDSFYAMHHGFQFSRGLRGDFGLTALLYFRNFSGGKLLLGNPFNFKLPVQNWDLLFLRSSAIYHRSLPFIGNKINLIFYSSIMKGKDI
jgi:hypothetical protein